MASVANTLEDLPADQRAVISLLVRQGRPYREVAKLLHIDEAAVRGRAEQALAALAAPPADLDPDDRGLVGDYLLGQLDESGQIEALDTLFESERARAWARQLASALEPVAALASRPLPEVPSDTGELSEPEPRPRRERVPKAAKPPRAPKAAREPRAPGAGLGPLADLGRGGIVLAVAGVAIVAAVIVFAVGGKSSNPPRGPISKAAGTATSATAVPNVAGSTTGPTGASGAAATNGSSAKVVATAGLTPTAKGSKARGAVEVLTSGSQQEMAFDAANLAAPATGQHYVLWLYASPTQAEALGVLPAFSGGTVQPLAVPLPTDASSYHSVVLTLETTQQPAHPGQIVLQGTANAAL